MSVKVSPRLKVPSQRIIILLFLLFVLLSSYSFIVSGFYFTLKGLSAGDGLVDLMGKPAGHDFVVFWAASKIARSEDPSAVYSLQKLNDAMQSAIGTNIERWAWNYPPTFLLIVYPFSYVPYIACLVIWIVGPLIIYLYLIRYLLPHPVGPWVFLGFPSVVYNMLAGQNGLLSVILLTGGLLLLERRPFLGGILLGIMSYKPQLFGLLPFALIAGRHWRALGGLAVAMSGLILLSMVIFGYDTWQAFYDNIQFAAMHWQCEEYYLKMPTFFAVTQLLGYSTSMAVTIQLIMAFAAIGIVIWVWYEGTCLILKGSVLSLCIPLFTPYLFPYDLIIISLPFAWLGWMVHLKGDMNGLAVFILCWIALFFSTFYSETMNIQLTPIIIIIMLSFTLMCLIHKDKKYQPLKR